MIVEEAITILGDLRESKEVELTVNECHAIGIAMVVMISLEPRNRDMVNALLVLPLPSEQ